MSQTIPGLLSEFEQAIETANYQTAAQTVNTLTDRYETQMAADEIRMTRAFGASDISVNTPAYDSVQMYAVNATAVAQARAGFLTQVTSYLSDPATATSQSILEPTRTLREREETLSEAREFATDAIEGATVPAAVQLLTTEFPTRFNPKGASETLTVAVGNAGDSPADGVVIEVTDPDGLTVTPSTTDLGTLDPRERATVAVEVTYDVAGEYTLTVDLDPTLDSTDFERLDVIVRTKLDLITTGIEGIEDFRARLGAVEMKDGPQNGLDSKLANANRKTEQAKGFAMDGRAKQANNMLNAATRILGAFLNQLDALTKTPDESNGQGKQPSIPPADHWTLDQTAEHFIDLLVAAQRADL